MKILFCTNSLGARGGIEMVTIVKANALADMAGTEVGVCFTDRGTYPSDLIHPLSPKVRVIDLGVTFWDLHPLNARNLLVEAPRKFVRLRKALRQAIRDFRPDVVVTTGSYEKYALATLNPSKLLGKPCAKVREYHFNSNYRSCLPGRPLVAALAETLEYKVLGRMFDMNYLLTREDKVENFPRSRKFGYQYNPVTFEASARVPTGSREKAVIVVCRLTYQKNVHATLRAWAAVHGRAPGWVLRIVGDGEDRPALEALAGSLGIGGCVEFAGFSKDVARELRRARILAMTSRYEGFGINIVEAMACGTVPVAFRTPYGPADIITDGTDGVLVDFMDEHQYAERLLALIRDPRRLEEMSVAAFRRADDFSTGKIAAQWMEKYESLLKSLKR